MSHELLRLRVEGPGGPSREQTFGSPVIKIGRAPTAHVVLHDPAVNLVHTLIEATLSGWRVVDLDSATGTTLNGKGIVSAKLADGDEIGIADYVLLVSYVAPPPRLIGHGEPLTCPRCRNRLEEARWTTGGGYRGGVSATYLRCDPCAISIVGAELIAARFRWAEERLSGTVLERHRRPSDEACPRCLSRLEHVTLSWASFWVELEECARCGEVALDDGEGALLARMLEAHACRP